MAAHYDDDTKKRHHFRLLRILFLFVVLLNFTSAQDHGCDMCAASGDCSRAFHEQPGQFCGKLQTTQKTCCCPPSNVASCKRDELPSQCKCIPVKITKNSTNSQQRIQNDNFSSATATTTNTSNHAQIVLGIVVILGCFYVYRQRISEIKNLQSRRKVATYYYGGEEDESPVLPIPVPKSYYGSYENAQSRSDDEFNNLFNENRDIVGAAIGGLAIASAADRKITFDPQVQSQEAPDDFAFSGEVGAVPKGADVEGAAVEGHGISGDLGHGDIIEGTDIH